MVQRNIRLLCKYRFLLSQPGSTPGNSSRFPSKNEPESPRKNEDLLSLLDSATLRYPLSSVQTLMAMFPRWNSGRLFCLVENSHSGSLKFLALFCPLPCSQQPVWPFLLSPTIASFGEPSLPLFSRTGTSKIALPRMNRHAQHCMSHIFSRTAQMRSLSEAVLGCIQGDQKVAQAGAIRKLHADTDRQLDHSSDRGGMAEKPCASFVSKRDLKASLTILTWLQRTHAMGRLSIERSGEGAEGCGKRDGPWLTFSVSDSGDKGLPGLCRLLTVPDR